MQQNEYLQTALDDISTIKKTLEKSKLNYRAFGILFVVYAALELFCSLYSIIAYELIRGFEASYIAKALDAYNIIGAVIAAVALAVQLVVYFTNFKSLKLRNDVNTLPIYKIWGVVLLLVPTINEIIIRISSFIYQISINSSDTDVESYTNFIFKSQANVILSAALCLSALFFTGVMTKDKRVQVTSITSICIVSVFYLAFSYSLTMWDKYLWGGVNLVILGVGIYYLIKAKKTYG